MSREVAGEDEGATLAECLADGRIPIPEKMTFFGSGKHGERQKDAVQFADGMAVG